MSEIWNLSTLCRCCHADGALRKLQAPYVHDGAIEIYAVLLRDTFGLHINPPTIEASYSICESCIELVRLAHRFKKQVQECEKKFHQYCENERTHNISDNVKFEVENDSVIINPGVDDEDNEDIDDSDGGYSEVDSEFEDTGEKSKEEKSTKIFCEFCNDVFKSKRSRRTHVFQVHMADGLSCKLCEKTFADQKALHKHFSSHHIRISRCQFCTEVFGSSEQRERHEYSQHVQLTGYVCDQCQKSFQCKISLARHIAWHKRANEFVCQTCGYAFKRQNALKVHIETVHENKRRFQCYQCGKAYKSKKSLILHSYDHTGKLPFKCQICSKGCKTKTDLRYHMENSHQEVDRKSKENEVVGFNLGRGSDDDDEGSGDSDGGYENNDLENESEVEIEICKEKIEVDVKPGNDWPVGPDDIKTEECVYGAEECANDSPDGGDYVRDDDNNIFQIEIEECTDEKNIEVKTEAKTTERAKRKDKHKGKLVKNMSNNYEFKWTCDFCQEQFASIRELRGHYSDNHVPEDTSCSLCNLSFSKRSDVIKHLALKHEKLTLYCQFCIETFNTLRALQNHQHLHTRNGYICDCCDKKFKWKKTLIRHLSWQMGNFEQFTCETCGRAFKLLSNLKAHIQFVHEKLKPFKCDICDKAFPVKKLLVCHRRSHTGERPFTCDVCSKGFTSKDKMKAHRRKHDKVQTEANRTNCIQCDVCGKNYTNHTIKQHMFSHTKPFKCDLCGESFSQKCLLIRHKKNKHKPNEEGTSLICKICNKSYYKWEVHKRIHERKPFKCHLCDKFYAEQITLDRHLHLMHFKVRKHSCDICNKMFTRPETVRKHVERKHNSGRKKNKKERKNKKKGATLPAVKLDRVESNFDSVLPAHVIPIK